MRTRDEEFLLEMGIRIRRKRLEMGLTISELSRISGISAVAIQRLELGEVGINIWNFCRLCKALKVSADKLLGLKK